jgi:hypothetical protein
MSLVRRDPFSRVELHREIVPNLPGGCPWCGMTNSHGRLFLYHTESDGGRKTFDEKAFCSLNCREIYYA